MIMPVTPVFFNTIKMKKHLNKTYTRVIACKDCKGAGFLYRAKDSARDENYETITCKTCQGSGRIIVKTTIEYEPYVISKYNINIL
jgi:DnaJ-class molecular chaperone